MSNDEQRGNLPPRQADAAQPPAPQSGEPKRLSQ